MINRNNYSKSTTALLLAGLATGAAAWYFMGTDNGRKTMSNLSGSLKGFGDSVVNKANDTFANLKNKTNNMM